jgi:hypothetical protein
VFRVSSLVAPAGDAIVVLGGIDVPMGDVAHNTPAAGGLIYREGAKDWSSLDLPFSAPLYGPGAVWTGDQLIVVGSPCDEEYPGGLEEPHCATSVAEAAQFAPNQNEWATIAAPPGELAGPRWRRPAETFGLGWTGELAVFQFAGSDGSKRHGTYDPREDAWSELPSVDGEPRDLCVAGGEILAVAIPGGPQGNPGGYVTFSQPGLLRSARYDVAKRRWIDLPDQALVGPDPTATALLRCEGDEAIITRWPPVGQTNQVQWFEPSTGTWPAIPSPPDRYMDATPARVDNTRVLYTTEGRYWLLDDGSTQWRGVPKPPTPSRVEVKSIGDQLVLSNREEIDITLLRPKDYAAEHAVSASGS